MEDLVKFALYDSFGGFIGYKSDSYWRTSRKKCKFHPKEDMNIDSRFFDNAIYVLNSKLESNSIVEWVEKMGLNSKGSLYVVAEDMKGVGLSGVIFSIEEDSKYHMAGRD